MVQITKNMFNRYKRLSWKCWSWTGRKTEAVTATSQTDTNFYASIVFSFIKYSQYKRNTQNL